MLSKKYHTLKQGNLVEIRHSFQGNGRSSKEKSYGASVDENLQKLQHANPHPHLLMLKTFTTCRQLFGYNLAAKKVILAMNFTASLFVFDVFVYSAVGDEHTRSKQKSSSSSVSQVRVCVFVMAMCVCCSLRCYRSHRILRTKPSWEGETE